MIFLNVFLVFLLVISLMGCVVLSMINILKASKTPTNTSTPIILSLFIVSFALFLFEVLAGNEFVEELDKLAIVSVINLIYFGVNIIIFVKIKRKEKAI